MAILKAESRLEEQEKALQAAAEQITPHQPSNLFDDLGISDEECEDGGDVVHKQEMRSMSRNNAVAISEEEMKKIDHAECERELNSYLACPVEKGIDPLLWWSRTESVFPTLSKIAKCHLGIPATSVESERIFSLAGEVISKRRSSLTPGNASMLVRLNLLSRYSPSDFDAMIELARRMYVEAQKNGKKKGGSASSLPGE